MLNNHKLEAKSKKKLKSCGILFKCSHWQEKLFPITYHLSSHLTYEVMDTKTHCSYILFSYGLTLCFPSH